MGMKNRLALPRVRCGEAVKIKGWPEGVWAEMEGAGLHADYRDRHTALYIHGQKFKNCAPKKKKKSILLDDNLKNFLRYMPNNFCFSSL